MNIIFITIFFSTSFPFVIWSSSSLATFRNRWVESEAHDADGLHGRFVHDAGMWFNDYDVQVGMKTVDPRKYYQTSIDMGKTINNRGKLLIISYTMKQEKDDNQTMAAIKLWAEGTNQKTINESTPFEISFGPNRGSTSDKRHFDYYMSFGGHVFQSTKMFLCTLDKFTHMYTLIIRPNNTALILEDGKPIHEGLLRDDFDVLGPRLVFLSSSFFISLICPYLHLLPFFMLDH